MLDDLVRSILKAKHVQILIMKYVSEVQFMQKFYYLPLSPFAAKYCLVMFEKIFLVLL